MNVRISYLSFFRQRATMLRVFLLLVFCLLFFSANTRAGVWTSNWPRGRVLSLAIDPLFPTTVYAGTAGRGVLKTTDGGTSWLPINTGLTNSYIEALVVDPLTPAIIYAGTLAGGVFKTTDGGGKLVKNQHLPAR